MHSNTALHCHLVCLEWQRLTWSPSHSTSRKTSQKQISSITPMTIRAFHCYLQRGMKQETMGGASTGDFGLNSVSDPFWLWHCNVLWHTEFHLPHLKNGTSKIYLANLLWRNWAKVLGQEWKDQTWSVPWASWPMNMHVKFHSDRIKWSHEMNKI